MAKQDNFTPAQIREIMKLVENAKDMNKQKRKAQPKVAVPRQAKEMAKKLPAPAKPKKAQPKTVVPNAGTGSMTKAAPKIRIEPRVQPRPNVMPDMTRPSLTTKPKFTGGGMAGGGTNTAKYAPAPTSMTAKAMPNRVSPVAPRPLPAGMGSIARQVKPMTPRKTIKNFMVK